ncbi:MAG: hypothetical protein ACXVPU_07930 [Bacteroidia bacterium]
MKRLLRLPRLTTLSLALFLTSGVIVIADTGCRPKAACGSRRDHRIRKKRVKKFAPSMSYGSIGNTKINGSVFI